jgi:flagellin-like hook-associated protein FlgL
VNLDSTLAAGAGFSAPDAVGSEVTKATWSGEASYSTTVTVFDTLGQGHNLTFLFAKTAADTYKYRVVADSSEITGGTAGDLYQVAPEGTLVFAANGTLDTANSTLKDITMTNLANGAANIAINAANLSFNGSTQSAGPSAVLSLQQSNTTGFNSALGRLDAAINQIDTFRAEIGSRLNSAQTAKDAAGIMKDRVIGQRSNIEDADALSTYSDFARYQNAFQAALQSASQVIQPTLLDFLK